LLPLAVLHGAAYKKTIWLNVPAVRPIAIARVRIWEHPITSEVLETNDEIWHINRVKGKAFWLHYKQFEHTLNWQMQNSEII
jgi:hypothetical protein